MISSQLKRTGNTQYKFPPFIKGRQFLRLPVCRHAHPVHSEKGLSKRKDFTLFGVKSFLLEKTLFH